MRDTFSCRGTVFQLGESQTIFSLGEIIVPYDVALKRLCNSIGGKLIMQLLQAEPLELLRGIARLLEEARIWTGSVPALPSKSLALAAEFQVLIEMLDFF